MLCGLCVFFFFKQKTAYEMRISDWSSDVCSSDLHLAGDVAGSRQAQEGDGGGNLLGLADAAQRGAVEYLVQVIRVGQRGLRALGADVPRRHRVDRKSVV